MLPSYLVSGGLAVDLGAGTGALASRLQTLGWGVLAVDTQAESFKADLPFVKLDLNDPEFSLSLGPGTFDLVISTEVIEHLENPIQFLRNARSLLKPNGVAVITTPNVDNAPARVKFLLTGKLRMMDERGEPNHITPVFQDLLVRQYLPRAGLALVEHCVYPPRSYLLTRGRYRWAMRLLAHLLRGKALEGDNQVWCVRPLPGSAIEDCARLSQVSDFKEPRLWQASSSR